MKVFRPENNPVHTLVFIPSDYPVTTALDIDGIEVSASLPIQSSDGYASLEFIYNFTEGQQSEIRVGTIYKTKAFATDFPDLDQYEINPISGGNIIDL